MAIVGDGGQRAQLAIVNTILAPSAAGIVAFLTKRYLAYSSV